MTRIKICGLRRPVDINAVNEALPDFAGFIVNVPKSRRNVSPETLRSLRKQLRPEILPVGVFVNEPMETIEALAADGTISLVQLHGQEDEAYLAALRKKISLPIIKAFSVSGPEDVTRGLKSSADLILLDNGAGGTGKTFDWSLLRGLTRPWLLAGGLGPENLPEALSRLCPWGVDLSSGVETGGAKDPQKIRLAVQTVRACSDAR